jgi:hypothetical protein
MSFSFLLRFLEDVSKWSNIVWARVSHLRSGIVKATVINRQEGGKVIGASYSLDNREQDKPGFAADVYGKGQYARGQGVL